MWKTALCYFYFFLSSSHSVFSTFRPVHGSPVICLLLIIFICFLFVFVYFVWFRILFAFNPLIPHFAFPLKLETSLSQCLFISKSKQVFLLWALIYMLYLRRMHSVPLLLMMFFSLLFDAPQFFLFVVGVFFFYSDGGLKPIPNKLFLCAMWFLNFCYVSYYGCCFSFSRTHE